MILVFNTLKFEVWEKGNQLHQEMYLEFNNKELVSYEVRPELPHYTEEVVKGIVTDLIDQQMITFYDDVPQMKVHVPIWEIGVPSEEGNEMNPYYIETFHYHMDDVSLQEDDKDSDCVVPLHKYLWLERELNHTDM
jgi:hypothetical protein